jgi:hypothetical protein
MGIGVKLGGEEVDSRQLKVERGKPTEGIFTQRATETQRAQRRKDVGI